jgi:hypothetical protein
LSKLATRIPKDDGIATPTGLPRFSLIHYLPKAQLSHSSPGPSIPPSSSFSSSVDADVGTTTTEEDAMDIAMTPDLLPRVLKGLHHHLVGVKRVRAGHAITKEEVIQSFSMNDHMDDTVDEDGRRERDVHKSQENEGHAALGGWRAWFGLSTREDDADGDVKEPLPVDLSRKAVMVCLPIK